MIMDLYIRRMID